MANEAFQKHFSSHQTFKQFENVLFETQIKALDVVFRKRDPRLGEVCMENFPSENVIDVSRKCWPSLKTYAEQKKNGASRNFRLNVERTL